MSRQAIAELAALLAAAPRTFVRIGIGLSRHSRGGKGREDVLKVIHELQLAEELSSQGPIDPDDFAEANQLTPLEREIICAIDAGNRRKAIDLARLLLEAEYPK